MLWDSLKLWIKFQRTQPYEEHFRDLHYNNVARSSGAVCPIEKNFNSNNYLNKISKEKFIVCFILIFPSSFFLLFKVSFLVDSCCNNQCRCNKKPKKELPSIVDWTKLFRTAKFPLCPSIEWQNHMTWKHYSLFTLSLFMIIVHWLLGNTNLSK